jgi:hypothetical protein
MAPIPAEHRAAFSELVDVARELFDPADVAASVIGPGSADLPSLTVPGLSLVGEQWIVVEYAGGRRLELDWQPADLERAATLIRRRHRRIEFDRSAPAELPSWIAELVGSSAAIAVDTVIHEFDRQITVRPRRRSALPFEVLEGDDGTVVVEGRPLGWWTFGAEPRDDGPRDAKDLIEQLVLWGGSIRRTWRGVTLLDDAGMHVAGPVSGERLPLRPQRIRFLPYR